MAIVLDGRHRIATKECNESWKTVTHERKLSWYVCCVIIVYINHYNSCSHFNWTWHSFSINHYQYGDSGAGWNEWEWYFPLGSISPWSSWEGVASFLAAILRDMLVCLVCSSHGSTVAAAHSGITGPQEWLESGNNCPLLCLSFLKLFLIVVKYT